MEDDELLPTAVAAKCPHIFAASRPLPHLPLPDRYCLHGLILKCPARRGQHLQTYRRYTNDWSQREILVSRILRPMVRRYPPDKKSDWTLMRADHTFATSTLPILAHKGAINSVQRAKGNPIGDLLFRQFDSAPDIEFASLN